MDFIDNYSHPKNLGIMYFSQSIPTKEAEKLYDYNLKGCTCISECTADKCSCVSASGTNYIYNHVKDVKDYIIQEKHFNCPTYECNANCVCNEKLCGNKVVQLGPRRYLFIKPCDYEIKGLGLFTSKAIRMGTFVCEYAGEIIDEEQAQARFRRYQSERISNYIFCIKETFGTQLKKTFIDPTKYGNIGRYINHSCDPNCKLFIIRHDNTIPILAIFARRNISINEEITYNYDEDNSHILSEKSCVCQSVTCKKYLPLDISLS